STGGAGLGHSVIHSTTSLAGTSKLYGMVRPSAFAVLRLTKISNLVARCIGGSPGFAPFNLSRKPSMLDQGPTHLMRHLANMCELVECWTLDAFHCCIVCLRSGRWVHRGLRGDVPRQSRRPRHQPGADHQSRRIYPAWHHAIQADAAAEGPRGGDYLRRRP